MLIPDLQNLIQPEDNFYKGSGVSYHFLLVFSTTQTFMLFLNYFYIFSLSFSHLNKSPGNLWFHRLPTTHNLWMLLATFKSF